MHQIPLLRYYTYMGFYLESVENVSVDIMSDKTHFLSCPAGSDTERALGLSMVSVGQ